MTNLPIVFAPGMMCDHRLFTKQAEILGKDRPIFHADFSSGETITQMVGHLLEMAPPVFYLVGLSMGGICAFEVWRRAPERVAGLALMNTTAFADSPARRNTRIDQIERVKKGHLKTVVIEELKPNYLGTKVKKDQNILDEIYAMAEDLGPDVFTTQTKAVMRRNDSTPTLQTVTCPTIVIAGDEDEICPPELHEIIHKGIASSSLHILSGCGHLSSIEAAEQVTEILKHHILSIEKE